MRFLVVGGGSMGRRRLRDLCHLCPGNVSLLEADPKRSQDVAARYGLTAYTTLEDALAAKPDAMVISTPPAMHERFVREAVRRGIHIFCELPFVMGAGALAEIAAQPGAAKLVLGVSGTIRFYPPYSLIHQLLREGRIGKPLYLEYSLGNYIADWHPYEDYRKFYASDMALGGAGMDMILHELAPIQWWLGKIAAVSARLSKVSSLEIKGPDNHDMLLTFENGCRGFFHHDIIERGTIGRHIRIVGESGTIEWNQNQPAIRLFSADGNKSEELGFEKSPDWRAAVAASEEMRAILAKQAAASGAIPSSGAGDYSYESNYLREMRHFVEAVAGTHPYTTATVPEELQTLRVFDAVVASSKSFTETRVAG
jgi:predicted dehydrogenase